MKNKKNINFFIRKIALPAIALVFLLSACDSSNSVESTDAGETYDIAQSVAFISEDLDLTTAEISFVESAFGEEDGRAGEPGFLWTVAAKIQANLSDEQKAKLFERIANRPIPQGQMGNGHALGDHFSPRPGPFGHGPMDMGGRLELSDDQKSAIHELRKQFGDNLRDLAESVKAGTLDPAAARAQMKALADALKTELDSILTEEQKAELEEIKVEHEARRDARAAAEREAMISVLGLDSDQIAALEDLRATIDDQRAEFRELIEAGATPEEIQELAEAAHAAHQEALTGILDQTQYEIFVIHGALSSRMKSQGGPGGFARPYAGPYGDRPPHEG